MEMLLNSKELVKENDLNLDIESNRSKRVFTNITQNAIGKGADYVIRAMPINNNIKNILLDVRKSFDTKDFKQILKTVVNSSVDEGLKILNMPKNVIRDITKLKNITLKGGLKEGICAAIDIVTNKYLKNNLFYNIIKDFINKTKDFIFNKSFENKLQSGIDNILEKADKYKEKCNEWFKSYNELDFDKMNNIAKSLNRDKSKVANDVECIKQNSVIQNMMRLVNTKKDKLSPIQLQICSNL